MWVGGPTTWETSGGTIKVSNEPKSQTGIYTTRDGKLTFEVAPELAKLINEERKELNDLRRAHNALTSSYNELRCNLDDELAEQKRLLEKTEGWYEAEYAKSRKLRKKIKRLNRVLAAKTEVLGSLYHEIDTTQDELAKVRASLPSERFARLVRCLAYLLRSPAANVLSNAIIYAALIASSVYLARSYGPAITTTLSTEKH